MGKKRTNKRKKQTRKQRKIEKEKHLRQQVSKTTSKKNVRKKTKTDLYNDYNRIENQRKIEQQKIEKRREKARNQRAELHRKKVLALEEKGISWARNLSEGITRKIKLADIESGNVSRETYPNLFEKYDFTYDFNKVHRLPKDTYFYVAYRDYSCNNNIRDIIKDQKKKSNEQLLEELKHWNSTPKTYDGKSGTSSGSAGDMSISIGSKDTVKFEQMSAATKNRSKKTREHSGEYKGFQSIKLRESVFNSDISAREVLVIATSIMPNINEEDRKNFYIELYHGLDVVPEIQSILPKPE